jgi:hypothetical protein
VLPTWSSTPVPFRPCPSSCVRGDLLPFLLLRALFLPLRASFCARFAACSSLLLLRLPRGLLVSREPEGLSF